MSPLTGTAKVDPDFRILLPSAIRKEIHWINARANTECYVIPGSLRGIQVLSADSQIVKNRDEFIARISPPPRDDETHSEWFGHLRMLSAFWKSTIDNTGRLTIPSEIGPLGLLDRREGVDLAIIAADPVLEIWPAADLAKYIDENRSAWRNVDRPSLIEQRPA
jgi:bifunctional DNA-binding transcriptional regulator/antitoxin component of YhaV-PrlF toxin-antitoxin module